MKTMSKPLATLAFSASLLFTAGAVQAANEVSISGGSPTGQYIEMAESLCSSLGALLNCTAKQSGGSIANRQALERGEINAGLMMGPLARNWSEEPGFSDRFEIARTFGEESLFVIGKPETINAVKNYQGIEESAFLLTMVLPGEGSGDTQTFRMLQKGTPLAEMELKVAQDRTDMINKVANGGPEYLGFAAQFANPENTFFKQISMAGLEIMGIVAPDMALDEMYSIKTVVVKNAKLTNWKAQEITTGSLPVALVVRTPSDFEGREAKLQSVFIKKLKKTPEAKLLPQAGWIQKLANTASIKAGPTFDSLMKSAKEAAQGAADRIKSLTN